MLCLQFNLPDIERNVNFFLGQLTSGTARYVCDQLIVLIHHLDANDEGQNLIHIVNLIFQKATVTITRTELYAKLCRELLDRILIEYPSRTRVDGSEPTFGDELFTKELLTCCQEQFKRHFGDILPAWSELSMYNKFLLCNTSLDEEINCVENMLRGKHQAMATAKFMCNLHSHQILPENVLINNVKSLLKIANDPNDNTHVIEGLHLMLGSNTAYKAACARIPGFDGESIVVNEILGKDRLQLSTQDRFLDEGRQILQPVEPLKVRVDRWDKKAMTIDVDLPEMVNRKVRGLLNKLTMANFDSISNQIIAWVNKSEKEKDGRTLAQVIGFVFEKATDEEMWSEMYARLCRKMMDQISCKIQNNSIKNNDGRPIGGGQLFRNYLLNRCQDDFERGWIAMETTAAAVKATLDDSAKVLNDKKESGKEEVEEGILYSDGYYAAQKAKRQGLGLIKFIGELFKLQMLTERIMHECVKKLLGNIDNPKENEIEALCKLLTTVGGILDTPKARPHLDVYFSRMKELSKSPYVNRYKKTMLIDLIALRSERRWIA